MKLIAKVPVMVLVAGERTTIEPGQELPQLSEHDARMLLASDAVLDPAVEAKKGRAQARALADAQADFEEAQQRVRLENEARLQAEREAAENSSSGPDPDEVIAAKSGGKGKK